MALADVVSTTSDPRLGTIRLAWWRERLEALDHGEMAPAEPRLQAISEELLPSGISGEELSQLDDAWLCAFEPFPWSEEVAQGFRLRGRILFGLGARLLLGDPSAAASAGELWSLIDVANHCSDERSRECLLNEARKIDVTAGIARRLRPLTIITAVAVEELCAPSNSFGRGVAALSHRLTGRIPKFSRE